MNTNKTESHEYYIFLSWSGVPSRDYASIIKDFLEVFFQIKDKIFFSPTSLIVKQKNESWMQTIREKAQKASITISCITADNIQNPWIHYELGLATGNDIVPLFLDFDFTTMPQHMEMITYLTVVYSDLLDNDPNYHYYSILNKLAKRLFSIFKAHKYPEFNNINPDSYCTDKTKILNEYAIKLSKVKQKYNKKDWFISRPFNANKKFHSVIESVCKEKKVHIAVRPNSGDDNSKDSMIPETRCEQMANDQGFILIYPKMKGATPSSCLIEFGMAFALHLKIKVLIQKDAKLPMFLELVKKSKSVDIQEYENYEDLKDPDSSEQCNRGVRL